MIKALIITGFGINCETELAAAFTLAGAQSHIAHINEIIEGHLDIHEYDILNFPGGFSFGDDLGSGKVMANKLKYKLLSNSKTILDELKDFLKEGKFILGICNGFQFLVRLGLVPNTQLTFDQEATLAQNDSGKYEDRWIFCKVNPLNNSPFLKDINMLPLPVRHGEGKLIAPADIEASIINQNLHALTYCLSDGSPALSYPQNPNGSTQQIAGLSDTTGQVLGLMPHPEAFLSLYNHPSWTRLKKENPEISEKGLGLQIFENIISHIKKQKT